MKQFLIHPHPAAARFVMEGHHTWGASMCRDDDGQCHLYASAWPVATGHAGWVTHSMIVHAVADDRLGPFRFENIVLGPQQDEVWDRDVAHNPTIVRVGEQWLLYYMGNRGNGDYHDHRNRQRIGVAVADRPSGPFRRRDKPLLAPGEPGAWDDMITMNPSCTRAPDGRFVLVYKAASRQGSAPKFGPVKHGVAFSESPTGPFRKHPDPIFDGSGVFFAAEDPFVWHQDGQFFCILKDMARNFSAHERALVLFASSDAIDWAPHHNAVVTTREIIGADGRAREYNRLERPQLYLENGAPKVLYVAVKPDADSDESYNISLPVEFR